LSLVVSNLTRNLLSKTNLYITNYYQLSTINGQEKYPEPAPTLDQEVGLDSTGASPVGEELDSSAVRELSTGTAAAAASLAGAASEWGVVVDSVDWLAEAAGTFSAPDELWSAGAAGVGVVGAVSSAATGTSAGAADVSTAGVASIGLSMGSAVIAEPPVRRSRAVRDKVMEVAMKIMAATVVTRLIIVAGPREPKTEPEEPPKAAPMPEFLPAWSKTLMMRITATRTCIKVMALNIGISYPIL
jgi:hypothetical protein